MPRRSRSLHAQVPSGELTGTLPSPAALQEQATRLLVQAHELLAETDEEIRALERCLVVLAHAPAESFFFYYTDPPTLIPAVGRKARAFAVATLQDRLTRTRQHARERTEAIRLNTLLTLSRLGVPIALWHFLVPGSLPLSLEALAPTGAHSLTPTGHSPPSSDPLSSSLFVSSLD